MQVTIDGVKYVVTPEELQEAFDICDAAQSNDQAVADVVQDRAYSLIHGLALAPNRGRPKGGSTFDLKRAKQLRKQGQTYPEIAAELGCSSRTVIRKLKGGE